MITFTIDEIREEAVSFINAYKEGCRGLGHPVPDWADELVKKTAIELVEQEQYEDDDHFGMCFARDLVYTLDQLAAGSGS